jgi:hypothetical protein
MIHWICLSATLSVGTLLSSWLRWLQELMLTRNHPMFLRTQQPCHSLEFAWFFWPTSRSGFTIKDQKWDCLQISSRNHQFTILNSSYFGDSCLLINIIPVIRKGVFIIRSSPACSQKNLPLNSMISLKSPWCSHLCCEPLILDPRNLAVKIPCIGEKNPSPSMAQIGQWLYHWSGCMVYIIRYYVIL